MTLCFLFFLLLYSYVKSILVVVVFLLQFLVLRFLLLSIVSCTLIITLSCCGYCSFFAMISSLLLFHFLSSLKCFFLSQGSIRNCFSAFQGRVRSSLQCTLTRPHFWDYTNMLLLLYFPYMYFVIFLQFFLTNGNCCAEV